MLYVWWLVPSWLSWLIMGTRPHTPFFASLGLFLLLWGQQWLPLRVIAYTKKGHSPRGMSFIFLSDYLRRSAFFVFSRSFLVRCPISSCSPFVGLFLRIGFFFFEVQLQNAAFTNSYCSFRISSGMGGDFLKINHIRKARYLDFEQLKNSYSWVCKFV